jgi:hypothetical protein
MEGGLRLATEIVVLLTVVVGLFKVTTIPSRRGPAVGDLPSAAWPLGMLLTVIGFMLFPILIMVGIRGGMYLMEKMDEDVSEPLPFSIPVRGSDSLITSPARALVTAALSSSRSNEQAELLKRAVTLSLEVADYEAALVAADAIPYAGDKSERLAHVAEVAALNNAFGVAATAVTRIPHYAPKSEALARLADILEGKARAASEKPSTTPDTIVTSADPGNDR